MKEGLDLVAPEVDGVEVYETGGSQGENHGLSFER